MNQLRIENHLQIRDLLLNVIVQSNLPYSIVRSNELKKLLETVSGREVAMSSIPSTMTALKDRFDLMVTKLKHLISLQRYVCCTTDIWSHMRKSYLGVSVHFIDSNWEHKSYILAFRYLNQRHTFDYLAECLDSIFKEYEIPVDKIPHIVTDSGSNLCKAFKEFGKESDFSESLAMIQQNNDDSDKEDDDIVVSDDNTILVLDNDDDENNTPETNVDEREIEIEIQQANIQGIQINFPSDSDDLDTDILLPPQMRCFAHLLNLIGKRCPIRH